MSEEVGTTPSNGPSQGANPESNGPARVSDWTPPSHNPAPTQTATQAPDSPFLTPGQKTDTKDDQILPGAETSTEIDPFFADADTQDPSIEPTDAQTAYEKFTAWTNSDLLDLETFGDKKVPIKTKNGTEMVSVQELAQGGMRLNEFSRRMNEVKQVEQQAKQVGETFTQHFQAVKEPAKFLEEYTRMGYGDTLYQVAELIAQSAQQENEQFHHPAGLAAAQRVAKQYGITDVNDPRLQQVYDQAVQESRGRLKDQRGTQEKLRQLEYDKKQLEDKQKEATEAQQVAELGQRLQKQISFFAPNALKAVGVNYQNTEVKRMYLDCIQEVMQLHNDNEVNQQVAVDAAVLLSERTKEWRQKWAPGKAQPQGQAPMGRPASPSRQAGAAGGTGASRGPIRVSDWKPPR